MTLLRELRQAVRVLRRAPSYASIAVLTLALGIGAATAAFAVVDGILLRPLTFPDAGRLALAWTSVGSRVSAQHVHAWRVATPAFADLAAWFDGPVQLASDAGAVTVPAYHVTSNFFTVLGAQPWRGRWLTTEPTLREVPSEVVLSYGAWQRRFGGDPGAIGRVITVDGERVTIVGVTPPGFAVRTLERAAAPVDLFRATALVPVAGVGMGGVFNVIGRLAPTSSIASARAELLAASQRLELAQPSYSRDWTVQLMTLHDATVRDVRLTLIVAFGSVAVLLLIACVNVATLTLVRAAARQREFAVRRALGASVRQLVRQALFESTVLVISAGVLGLILARWLLQLTVWTLPAGFDLPRLAEVGLDWRAALFASGVGAFAVVGFALTPVLPARRQDMGAVGRAVRGQSAPRAEQRTRQALTIVEVALSLLLLAGAGLLARSFWTLQQRDPGFAADPVLTMRVTRPGRDGAAAQRTRQFTQEVRQRLATLPGVEAVGTADYLPMSRAGRGGAFDIVGRPAARVSDRPGSWMAVVGGDYFAAMGIPLLRGRLPGETDTMSTTPVVVIDQSLAERLWPGANPVGAQVLWRTGPTESLTAEIIGVVGAVRWGGSIAEPPPMTYFWSPQRPGADTTFVVKASAAANLPAAMTSLVAALDPTQSAVDIVPMRAVVADDLARPRLTAALIGGFAAGAVVIAAVGLYGVVAFAVGLRRREIGVRLALGASRRDILQLLMRQGLTLVGAGLVLGGAAALALGRVAGALLHGVTPADPLALGGALVVLALAGGLATYLPARRAARLAPLDALRAD